MYAEHGRGCRNAYIIARAAGAMHAGVAAHKAAHIVYMSGLD